jgi:hypothetical protein
MFRSSFLLFLSLLFVFSFSFSSCRRVSVSVNVDVPASSATRSSSQLSATEHIRDMFSTLTLDENSLAPHSGFDLDDAEAEAEVSKTSGSGFVPIQTKRCGNSNDPLHLSTIESTQWPLQEGSTVTVRLSGTLSTALQSGKFQARVLLFGIVFFKKEMPIPQLYLPKPAGPFTAAMTFNVPRKLGFNVDIEVMILNENNQEFGCIAFNADI